MAYPDRHLHEQSQISGQCRDEGRQARKHLSAEFQTTVAEHQKFLIPDGWAAHAAFVAPAQRHCEIWRVVVGLVLVIAIGLALNTSFSRLIAAVAPQFWVDHLQFSSQVGRTPMAIIVALSTFGFFLMGVVFVVKVLHDRAALTLIGAIRPAWKQFQAVVCVLALIGVAVWLLPPYGTSLEIEPNPNLTFATWLGFLPLALGALLIQCGAEEILFRGYLQQQLAARFRSPAIWAAAPAFFFALGHYAPSQAGENAILVALWAFVFGLLMADLTARAGTLGPAIAVHVVNNFSALLIISVTNDMNGLALFVSPEAANDPDLIRAWLPADFAALFVAWLGARLAIRR